MENTSLTSVEKLMFNSNDKNKNIHKGKIVNNNGNLELILLTTKTSKYKIESIQLLEDCDQKEEFLDSGIFTNSELNSKQNLINIEEEKVPVSLNKRSKNEKKKTLCLLIDNIVSNNNVLKNYKKYSTLTISNFEETKKEEKIDPSKINLSEAQINDLFNLINKNNLLETNCSICFTDFEINQEIGLIRNCLHVFHYECLDNWTGVKGFNKNNCPYCKVKIDVNL